MTTAKSRRRYLHSFARQYLEDHNLQVYSGEEMVLEPVGKIYDVKRPNTHFYVGEQFIEQGELKQITNYAELKDMGYVIVSVNIPMEKRWDKKQKRMLVLKKATDAIEHTGKMIQEHCVELDTFNKGLRIVGPRAGPLNVGEWVSMKQKEGLEGAGREKTISGISKDFESIIDEQMARWTGEESKFTSVQIRDEIPFMVTDANEIICIPNTQDMPSILVCGMKRCQIGTDKVMMGDGTFKEIKEVKEGDIVISPQEDGTIVSSNVTRVTRYWSEKNYEVRGKESVLYTCSRNHIIPFMKWGKMTYFTAEQFSELPEKMKYGMTTLKIGEDTSKKWTESKENIRVDVVPSKADWVYGIVIDSPSRLYITNEFFITHNSGKSFLTHSLISRFFWQPTFNYKIAVLNDSSAETGTWVLPNKMLDQINTLKKLYEKPLPLPGVYFNPMIKGDPNKLHFGEVGFDITIPFKEVIQNYEDYIDFGDSKSYFEKIRDKILECEDEESVNELLKDMTLMDNIPVNSANKIRVKFQNLFSSKMFDISTPGQKPWYLSNNTKVSYNPFRTCLHAGLLPILVTESISTNKEVLSLFFNYIARDLFAAQKQDKAFIKEQSELLLVVDEAHNISGSGKKGSPADFLLRRCVKEGGPRRIGTLLSTQKFGELPSEITDNTTYLMCFKSPGESSKIANQYKLGRMVAGQIKELEKHQCLAWTSEYYVVYNNDGKKRRSRLGETFIGKTLPPYSMHKQPKVDD